ncbi:MAG: AraC family transcriptional regulator [Roseburia faecis]|nr:AraC family transcriptional regulator [Roseburia faecis]
MGGADENLDNGYIGQAGNYIVTCALSYIREHYSEKLTLNDVADHVYCSHWHLSRLLAATGSSFSEAVNNVRVEEAKKRMRDPKSTATDTAATETAATETLRRTCCDAEPAESCC